MVDLTPDADGNPKARPLDLVPGRSGKAYSDWLDERGEEFKDGVEVVILDPFHGYKNAIDDQLEDATAVLDAFHVVKPGNDALDEVCRRVQQQTLGHRGHNNDPPYRVRRLLRRGAETLSREAMARIDATLAAADPDWEVTIAWSCAQQPRAVYHAPMLEEGRRRAEKVIQTLPTCPIPRWPGSGGPCAAGGPSSWPTSTPAARPTALPRPSTC